MTIFEWVIVVILAGILLLLSSIDDKLERIKELKEKNGA
jgi:hypothetical protein